MKKQVTLGVQGLTDLENYLKQYERAIKQTRKELVDELCVTGEALLAEYSPVEDHELKSSTPTHTEPRDGIIMTRIKTVYAGRKGKWRVVSTLKRRWI